MDMHLEFKCMDNINTVISVLMVDYNYEPCGEKNCLQGFGPEV